MSLTEPQTRESTAHESPDAPFLLSSHLGEDQSYSVTWLGTDHGFFDRDGRLVIRNLEVQTEAVSLLGQKWTFYSAAAYGEIDDSPLLPRHVLIGHAGSKPGWVLNRDPLVIALGDVVVVALERKEAVSADLATHRIDREQTEQALTEALLRC